MITPVTPDAIRDIGDGPPVILVHPLGANEDYWGRVEALLHGRRLISYSLPGHGGRALAPRGYGIDDLADDLARVLDAAELDRASVVGVSIGGLVAQAFATMYPQRTESLVLVDCVAVYPPDFAAGLTARAQTAREQGLAVLIRPTLDLWFTAKAAHDDTELIALVQQMLLSADPEGYARACEALVAADLTADAPEIRATTTILAGEHEVPAFSAGAEWLHANIPGSALEWIADGRHAASLECSSEFASILDRVLPR
jgi:3-oxoadipate enol-lactonase